METSDQPLPNYKGFPYAHIKGLKETKPRKKAILWHAISKYTGKMLKTDTNIRLLRAEFGDSCDYKPKY